MSDLGWRADGISRARAAGGRDLEVYRRPGFTGGLSVRVLNDGGGAGGGFSVDSDPGPDGFEFTGGLSVRVLNDGGGAGGGFSVDSDPGPDGFEEDPKQRRRAKR